jgi:hypothetical protein
MSFKIILLVIGIALLAFFLLKPVQFNEYKDQLVNSVKNFLPKNTAAPTNTSNTEEAVAENVPGQLGQPFKRFDCTTVQDCKDSFPDYAKNVTCNNDTGICELI